MSTEAPRFLGFACLGAAAYLATRTLVRQYRRFDFRGRSVLITGGSRGLGLVLARTMADEGARVAICARGRSELERAKRDLMERGAEVLAVECDLRQRESVEGAVREVEQTWGAIDVLINNAGVIQVGPAATMTAEDFKQAMDVHYWGALHTILAVLPEMRRRRHGRIVNIASIGGEVSVPHLLPYCSSKHALVGLSQGLRAELVQEGIYVTTVSPGLMRTGSTRHAQFKGQQQSENAWFSLGAGTPGISMNARRAAEQIVDACRYGQAHLVLSWNAKLAALLNGVAPSMTAELAGWVNRLLPVANSTSTAVTGARCRPEWLPSYATYFNDKAARENNE